MHPPILTFTHVETGVMSIRPRTLCPRAKVLGWRCVLLDDGFFGRYVPWKIYKTLRRCAHGYRFLIPGWPQSIWRNPRLCEASSRDYLPPVCGPGSGHIGHGCMIQGTCRQGTYRPGDVSSKEGIVQGMHYPRDASSKVTHRPRTSVRGHIGRWHIVIASLMPWTIQYSI